MAVRPWLKKLALSAVRHQRKNIRKRHDSGHSSAQILEERALLSAAVLFAGGELKVLADANEDITIQENPNPTSPGLVQVVIDGTASTSLPGLQASQVTAITIISGNGENVIDLSGVTAVRFANIASISIDSGDGNDQITGSPDFANNISAGDGADTITGGSAADTLNGEDGDDVISGGAGNDSIDAGNGNDSVLAEAGADTIIGDDGADTLDGGSEDDSIVGGDGADQISGQDGNDTILGDMGADVISGGNGFDYISAGGGNDNITGDADDDTIYGNGGRDTLQGSDGNDFIDGQDGNDSILGGNGFDVLQGNAGDDTVAGEGGNDTVMGAGGNDVLYGDSANTFSPDIGDDLVKGQGGNDTIFGGAGSDQLLGGTGDDLIQSGDLDVTPPVQISVNDVTSGFESDGANLLFGPGSQIGVTGQPFFYFTNSVKLGDLDNDGDVDIAATSGFNNAGNVAVFLNQGAGVFAQGVTYASTGTNLDELELADFDLDGDLDIATVSHLGGSFGSVLLNNGDGTFGTASDIQANLNLDTIGIATGDFDGDGDADIAFATHLSDRADIFLSNGDGTFTNGGNYAVSGSIEDVVSADFNNDGLDDLALPVSFGNNSVDILLATGGGRFGAARSVPVAANPELLAVGDVDGDGDPDLAVSHFFGSNVFEILTNGGSGNFSVGQTITVPGINTFGNGIDFGDFDNDGDADLAIIDSGFGGANDVYIAVNNGAGQFATPIGFNTTPNVSNDTWVTAGDIDGDGDVDLVATDNNGVLALFNSPVPPPVLNFTVSLSQAATVPVTVDYSTVSGTASENIDYTGASGRLTFLPGQISQSVSITVIGDTLAESPEYFSLQLSNPTNAVITDSYAQGLVVDDDGGPTLQNLSISDVTISPEGNSGTQNATFTVTLSSASASAVTVDFTTGDQSALDGFDFLGTSGTLTFAPGTLTQTITVPVVSDTRPENDETFMVNLSNPTNAVLSDSRGIGTIVNDDSASGTSDDTLDGEAGNDTLLGSAGDDLLIGGSGNDRADGREGNDIIYGAAGNDSLNGGVGDDSLFGQGGRDTLSGDEGEDTLVWDGSSDGKDTLIGGDGGDAVEIRGSSGADSFAVGQTSAGLLTVTQGSAFATVDASVSIVYVNGQGGADSITIGDISRTGLISVIVNGGAGSDQINASGATISGQRVRLNGEADNDTITGSSAGDSINGGDGDDVINARGGDDSVQGGAGSDTINAGTGNDSVDGGVGNDSVTGDAGDDSLSGSEGDDSLDGGDGNDSLVGGFGNDYLNGNTGNDTGLGGSGSDSLIGAAGADYLDGGRNDDVIQGNSGNDTLLGNHGNDLISGGNGDDEILGDDGNDTISGGDGNDGIAAGNGNDVVTADEGNDVVTGGDGNDSLNGGGGADTLLGEEGDDVLNGNGGNDTGATGQGNDAAPISVETIDESFKLTASILAKLDGV